MVYRLLADAVLWTHLCFILFVVFGGSAVYRWPKMALLHVPAFLWGGLIAIGGWICPLTYLENDLRMKGTAEGYDTSFVENYILPLIYPELLFPGGFPKSGFIWIGVFVLTLNGILYCLIIRKHLILNRSPTNRNRINQ